MLVQNSLLRLLLALLCWTLRLVEKLAVFPDLGLLSALTLNQVAQVFKFSQAARWVRGRCDEVQLLLGLNPILVEP